MKEFFIKPSIKYGEDSLDYLSTLPYNTFFIVTDKAMIDLKIIDKILEKLPKNSKIEIFQDVTPNPTDDIVERGLKQMIYFNPKCIIALGGGSPIDATKGMLYFYLKLNKTLNLSDFTPYFIAIPTTSGTGSEVTSYSVITSNNRKIALSDEKMLPNLSILNPIFTKTLPAKIIADTGMDVLTHAIEAYTSKVSSPFTNAMAKEAIKLVDLNLVEHYNSPSLSVPRENIQYASCLAGIAFNNSSLGINHSIAHSIGAKFHISHGRANAIILPYIVEYNSNAREKYCELANLLGYSSETPIYGKELFISFIKNLKQQLKIENSLKELNISFEDYKKVIPEILKDVKNDICTTYNPNPIDDRSLIELLIKIYFGM